jgi:hypothetical protein
MPNDPTHPTEPKQDQSKIFTRGNPAELLGSRKPQQRPFFCALCGGAIYTTREQLGHCRCGSNTWNEQPTPSTRPSDRPAPPRTNGEKVIAPPRKRMAPPPPRPAPPPPEPEPELKPPPAWIDEGDPRPLSRDQRARRRRQNSEVAILEKIRGCKLDIDRGRLYTGNVLSEQFAITEDEYKRVASQSWGRKHRDGREYAEFPHSFRPLGKTPKQLEALRKKFYRDQRKDKPMLNSRITRPEAFLNVLPPPPGRIRQPDAIAKAHRHPTWRDLTLGSATQLARAMRQTHPDIGSELRIEKGAPVWHLWRRPKPPSS